MRLLRPLVLLLAPLLAACGGSGSSAAPPPTPGTCAAGSGPPIVLSGQVRYERLVLTVGGVGPATEMRPARFVDVEVLDAAGTVCFGRDSTDATGTYAIVVAPPNGSSVQVVVWSRTFDDPGRDYTVHNANPPTSDVHDPNNAFRFAVEGVVADGSQTVDVDVPYGNGTSRPSVGFGVLDTMVRCLDQVAVARGGPVGPAHVYTRLGNNVALGGSSYFSPSANAIAILGGASGNLDNSDTDYFDDAVVAHELGHFVERHFSHSMSRGGAHGGELLEPAFAWSEGQATGFGNLLLAQPRYTDSVGTNGAALFSFSCENATGASDPAGIGGELTVAEILWDLGDGGAGPTDTDLDGVAVPLSNLYAALFSMEPALDAPYLCLFLQRLVALSPSVNDAQMAALMLFPENQGVTHPPSGSDIWPIPIAIGGSHGGTLDSLPPMPGQLKNVCRGLTSSAWYRLVVPAPTTVTIDLAITPIPGSGDDLELFLTSNAVVSFPLASSTNAGAADEQITRNLAAGSYIIRVEADCTGGGNRADYVLSVQ